jgi:hypothetical protein
MRKHTGMRPQDTPILIKLFLLQGKTLTMKDIASSLHISNSEVSESLNRSMLAGLVDDRKQKIMVGAFLDFLVHGMKYVFPQHPGPMARGMPTAHAHPTFRRHFIDQDSYVWPDAEGTTIGQAIEPFYPKQVKAAKSDEELYEILALLDMIRVGRQREVTFAKEKLSSILLHDAA